MKILHLLEKDNSIDFLRKIKDKVFFNDNAYKNIYASGYESATVYGLPKVHKLLQNDFEDLSFCTIVSYFATYNYDLAKFFSELLDPVIPNEQYATDSLTFCEDIEVVKVNEVKVSKYLQSF